MKKILTLICLLCSLACNAQENKVYFMPVNGMTLATVTNSHAGYQAGYTGGVQFEFFAQKRASLSLGVLYSMQGCRDANKTKINCSMEYINFPVLANFYLFEGFAVKAGLQPAVKLRAYAKAGGEALSMDDINTLDIAIPAGLSYEISRFVLEARYNWHVRRIGDGIKAHNSVFQLTLGYKFEL